MKPEDLPTAVIEDALERAQDEPDRGSCRHGHLECAVLGDHCADELLGALEQRG